MSVDGGKRAMKAATRMTLVIAAGAAGMLAAGPVGAVVAGIDAGLATDLAYTVAEAKPNGALFTAIDVLANQESPDSGQVFDALFSVSCRRQENRVGGHRVTKRSTAVSRRRALVVGDIAPFRVIHCKKMVFKKVLSMPQEHMSVH
jgi:hypothetical protein